LTAAPVGRAIKGWHSRRLAREAFALIEQTKWSEANVKASDAYAIRPTEPEAWRAVALLASRTNQWTLSLDWWKKLDEARRLTIQDRREFLGAAIAAGELSVAAKQAEALLAQGGGPAPIDLVFAGQIAARRSDPILALDYGERALADRRAKPYEILSGATLVLSVTSPYSEPYARAWKQIEDVARDPTNPASLDALTLLAREEALPPMPAPGSNKLLSLESTPAPATRGAAANPAVASGDDTGPTNAGSNPALSSTPQPQSGDALTLIATLPPAPAGRTMSLTEVAKALENHPDSRPYHKVLALEVRARQDPILTDQYVADAVDRFGNASRLAEAYQLGADLANETLLALATWLNKIGRPAKTLEILPEARAIQRQDLSLQYIYALSGLQRWNEIKNLLANERFPIDTVSQHMLLGVAQNHLGSAIAAINEWQRALESANTPGKLFAVAKYAEENSVNDIADAAYSEVIKVSPKYRNAYAARLRIALAAGRTPQAQTIAAEIAQLWPDDAAARNQDAYLRLLLGASDGAAEVAEREAEVLVAKEPRNWQARATLGLACLRLGRNKEALAAIREPRVTGVEPPGPLAVRVAILAANGYEDGARNDARLVSANRLLPEERALIAPLLQ
jgi:hypothetical protein